jgi:hypothetical protein
VADLDASADRYAALLGASPQETSTGSQLPDARTVHFALTEQTTITLAEPTDAVGELQRHLQAHGERPYLLRLYTTRAEQAGLLDPSRAHGARIELEAS